MSLGFDKLILRYQDSLICSQDLRKCTPNGTPYITIFLIAGVSFIVLAVGSWSLESNHITLNRSIISDARSYNDLGQLYE